MQGFGLQFGESGIDLEKIRDLSTDEGERSTVLAAYDIVCSRVPPANDGTIKQGRSILQLFRARSLFLGRVDSSHGRLKLP